MGVLLATVIGLGLAGFDPFSVLIAAAALASGLRERWIIAFGLVIVLGTALLGTVLSLTTARWVTQIPWSQLIPRGPVGALIEVGVALILLGWALLRIRRPKAERPPKNRDLAGPALLVTGALFVVGVLLDPAYIAAIIVLAHRVAAWEVVVGHLLWALLSQAPLVILMVMIACGAHQRAASWFQRSWVRWRPVLRATVTALLGVTGLVLALDGVWFAISGAFLIGRD